MQNWENIFSVSVGVNVGEGMGIDDEKSWLTLTHTLTLTLFNKTVGYPHVNETILISYYHLCRINPLFYRVRILQVFKIYMVFDTL